MIHVFIGTKAQYIKTAPLLRLMDARTVPYRLIDSGQHAAFSADLRGDLEVRQPDLALGGGGDVSSIPQAVAWAARLTSRLGSRSALSRDVFGDQPGICVVHGDTPSTLLAALMARRARLPVAHLEAGLRSHDLLHPFPEEAIRLAVMRLSQVLFAPDDTAVKNLERMGLSSRVVPLPANTSLEALQYALDGRTPSADGPVVVTMHRVENLHRSHRVDAFVDIVVRIAAERGVLFVIHPPTEGALAGRGRRERLDAAGVEMVPLLPHRRFAAALAAAPFVVTDGGSIQEECALLGVPTLLWRKRTERPDGLGRNVVLSRYDPAVVAGFMSNPEPLRTAMAEPAVSPSERALDVLVDATGR